VTYNRTVIQSQLVGIYNANNINAAITIGHYFNVDTNLIKKAIENYAPTNNRSQLSNKDSNQLILDAYNANPSSMAVALQHLIQVEASNKIAFLGDMFELGNESLTEHKDVIVSLLKATEIEFYFVGEAFYTIQINRPNFHFFATFETLQAYLSELKFENKYILIKGSRGMALERIVPLL
jgi:UDP-N-acetylmuramoyl-tripeptide--D-alanyl-D-alanine ligase